MPFSRDCCHLLFINLQCLQGEGRSGVGESGGGGVHLLTLPLSARGMNTKVNVGFAINT